MECRTTSPRPGFHIPSSILLVLLCAFFFFYRLADRDLWSSHEARAGMDAQTVLDDGLRGLPRLFDGRAELQKPPLYYWLVAALARLRGGPVDAWDVRLPAALAALLCVLALFAGLARGRGRPRAGLFAGLVLASAVHFTWLARIGRIDMPLTLTTTVAAGAMYLALRKNARPQAAEALLLLSYLAAAVGVLLKGPVGLALPAAVIVLHLVLEGEWPAVWEVRAWGRLVRRLGAWWGLPLVVVVVAPVYLWADGTTGGEFFRVFIQYHNIDRARGTSTLRTNPWWFYGPQFFGDFFPWSPLVVAAAVVCRRGGYWGRDADARFGAAWLLAVTGVLSLAGFKRADYLLPAYPGAALFLACVADRWLRQSAECRVQSAEWERAVLRWFIPAVAGVMAVVWLVRVEFLLPAKESFRDYHCFAAEVRRRAPAPEPVVFFRTEAHALAFHVGRPLAVVVDWNELNERLARPGTHYVVMPPGSAAEWPRWLRGVGLEEVLRNTDLSGGRHERPLVLLRGSRSTGCGRRPVEEMAARPGCSLSNPGRPASRNR